MPYLRLLERLYIFTLGNCYYILLFLLPLAKCSPWHSATAGAFILLKFIFLFAVDRVLRSSFSRRLFFTRGTGKCTLCITRANIHLSRLRGNDLKPRHTFARIPVRRLLLDIQRKSTRKIKTGRKCVWLTDLADML